MPYLGKTPSQGVRARYQFTPNAGTTSLSGADANGSTMTFTDGNYVDVYLNGVMLKAGVDYVTTTANTIGSLSATVASDVVDIIVYDTFSLFGGTLEGNVKVNNGTFNVTGATDLDSTLNVDGAMTGTSATFTTADNSAQLNLKSTDADANVGPRLVLQRDSGSPADNDLIGQIEFYGENDNDEAIEYARIYSYILDASDGAEDGALGISTKVATSTVSRIWINSTETIFNENSADLDFRVESNGLTHALFVDGGNDRTVLGYSSGRVPVSVLVPHSNSAVANAMRISTYGVGGYSSSNSIGAGARLEFGQYDDGYDWVIGSIATVRTGGSWAGALTFYTNNDSASSNNTERMRIDSSGNVGIGVSPTKTLDVKSTTNDDNCQIKITYGGTDGNRSGVIVANTHTGGREYGLYAGNNSTGAGLGNSFGIMDNTASAYRMVITANGDVAIGTTDSLMSYDSNSTKLTVYDSTGSAQSGYLELGATANTNGYNAGAIQWINNANSDATTTDTAGSKCVSQIRSVINTTDSNAGDDSGGTLQFWTKPEAGALAQRMTIDSSGDIFMGLAIDMGGRLNVEDDGVSIGEGTSSNEYRRMYWNTSNDQLQFWNGSNECVINSSGAFTDASDIKLKKDIEDIDYGINTVKALKPRKYKMKADDKEQVGFIAQEVAPYIPEVVVDNTNPDGEEQKGLVYGQLTAVLTKALQEAIEKIETLEAKVAKLEE